MTDRELEQRLRAWYAAEVGQSEAAPADLHESLAAIPLTTPTPLRPLTRRRGFTLLAVAAFLVVGGALAAGSGLLRFSSVVPPMPSTAVLPTSGPSPSETPTTTANLQRGGLLAFIKNVDKPERQCSARTPNCPTPRVWIVGTDGMGAHELLAGIGRQDLLGWSPDGSRLLYTDDNKVYVTDPSGSQPQPADTGCAASSKPTPLTCEGDSQVALSGDGRSIVFVRYSTDANGQSGLGAITTMDLATGRISVLNPTSPDGGAAPTLSPDGRRIAFFRYGDKDTGGPTPPRVSAIWIVDSDGQNLRQVSPTTLDAQSPRWSSDGTRIVFVSRSEPLGTAGDIYTMRPDGADVRRLTTDGISTAATWMPDGRILFMRSGGAAGWWTMDADGASAAMLVPAAAIGVAPDSIGFTHPAWQPIGGPAMVPPPWTPASQIAVGPPAPTPSPTPIPALAPGFSWTGSPATKDNSPLGETATRLADGRVLVTGSCSTAAELYDPATGTFGPTGSLIVVRAGKTATLLRDGHVLFAGGYNCAAAGSDGMWASAELYDPATGTFSVTGSMAAPREQHTATLLADGRVLIAGGISGNRATAAGGITLASYRTAATDSFLATAEIYDPTAGTFSKTGSMSSPHRGHTATLLQDGRVLVVGNGGESSPSSTAADVYDPASGTWSRTGPMKTGRWLHTATLLQDGRVLVLGGRSPEDSVYASAEIYDPRSGKFSSAGSMREGRQQHTATVLADGRVLIVAGYWSDGHKWRVLSAAETYDPATGNFSPIGSSGSARSGHTATLLNDGRVLIVGGEDIGDQGGVGVASAVLYQP